MTVILFLSAVTLL